MHLGQRHALQQQSAPQTLHADSLPTYSIITKYSLVTDEPCRGSCMQGSLPEALK